jgi:hypothetical protein
VAGARTWLWSRRLNEFSGGEPLPLSPGSTGVHAAPTSPGAAVVLALTAAGMEVGARTGGGRGGRPACSRTTDTSSRASTAAAAYCAPRAIAATWTAKQSALDDGGR